MELKKAERNDMPYIYSQMEKNFIHEEIRDYPDALKVFDNEKYAVYRVVESGEIVGFMCVWSLSEFSFLEHFVIYEQYRDRGYGGNAFDLLNKQRPFIVLECEPPESPVQKKRIEFYKRHGMVLNENDYYQPSYRKGGEGCSLKLMSSKKLVQFDKIVKEIYREVYQTKYE